MSDSLPRAFPSRAPSWGRLCAAGLLAAAALPASAVGVLNGDFEGGISPWQITDQGGGTDVSAIGVFDVTGAGATRALQLEVFSDEAFEFGGVLVAQTVQTGAGAFSFSADVAAFAAQASNERAGVFSLVLDGTVLDTVNLGAIAQGAVERASLSFIGSLTAGLHSFGVRVERSATSPTVTPFQFLDNLSLVAPDAVPVVPPPVPEPGTYALMLGGLGLLGALARCRRRAA